MQLICEKFHWDYYTYISQPSWFIENIFNYMSAEAAVQKQMDGK